ncbi:hypothetical protein T4D_16103 [Trichinella pseudospiralis]|uniref:Uncharacterized protein n=1 Tax=Trichinella pseudospiralis TaxID=6337 RepID=A0A0V1F9W8_TRIPS|nr:hypothetical protein T4D_16103 [Trichinella pseudospiralis]
MAINVGAMKALGISGIPLYPQPVTEALPTVHMKVSGTRHCWEANCVVQLRFKGKCPLNVWKACVPVTEVLLAMVTNKVWVFDGVNCIGTLTSSSCDDSMQKEAIHWIRQMQKSNEEALRLRSRSCEVLITAS